jgi:HEAT repeat protein/predicted DNA-binding WGR domain protein
MRTFTCTDGKSSKFWNIELNRRSFTVRFGKAGTSGQAQVKEFPNESAALKAHDKLVAEKLAKGNRETTPVAPASAAKTTKRTRAAAPATGKKAKGRSRAGGVADVPALIDALGDEDSSARVLAAVALARIGPAAAAAAPALVMALQHPEAFPEREYVERALGQIGPAAVPALVAALQDKSKFYPSRLVGAFVAIGAGAVDAVPALLAALRDEDTQCYAVQALIGIGPGTVPALVAALTDKNLSVRTAAADVLGCINPPAAVAAPALVAALRDKDSSVRAAAARALGKPAAVDAVPGLVEALGDEGALPDYPRTVSAAALQALQEVGPVAVPALIAAVQDKSNKGRRNAITALSMIGPAAAEAVVWESPHFQDLREVTLRDRHGRQSSLDGLLALVRSPRLPRLEAIEFVFSEDDEEQPDYLSFVHALAAKPEATRLRKLSLWGYRIGDAGVEALAASPHLANLTNLNLSRNEIGDEGALSLTASPHLAQLSALDLTYNQITARGAEALLNSPHLTNLASLDLGENKVATKARKALLTGKRPSLEVRFERPS